RSPRKTRSHLLAALYGFVKRDPPFSLMAVGGNSETKNKRKERKNMNPLTKFKKLRILPILLALGCFALPASAGTTQVSGIGVFNNGCQPPVGSPPADLGDYPPIEMSGSLDGCWYTYRSEERRVGKEWRCGWGRY